MEAANDWKGSLSAEQRAQIAALHKLSAWTGLKILVLVGIWAGCAVLALKVNHLAVRIPCWILIGFVMHGLGVFMHEGAHSAIFHLGVVDRVVGFLCGLPLLFPCSSYRATHLLHHSHENTPQDPDNLNANFKNRVGRWCMYYWWFLFGMPMYIMLITLTGPIRASGWKNKLAAIVEPLGIAGFFYGVYLLVSKNGWWNELLVVWGIPVVVAILVANWRGLAEHTQLWQTDPPDQLKTTRSLPSNAFIRFFFNNQNYHLEHHLFPGVPWNNLGKVHQIMRPIYEAHEAAVCPSYLQWAIGAFRWGPLKTVSYRYADHKAILDPPSGPAINDLRVQPQG